MNSNLKLIAGDASDRKFYRQVSEQGQNLAICMQFPQWEGGFGGDPASWLNIQEALVSMNIPVPEVYKINQNACEIWTEDLGDQLLSLKLPKKVLDMDDKDCAESIQFYKNALDLLLQVQYGSTNLKHKALERAFDFKKLYEEMMIFVDHFLNGFLKLGISEKNHPVLYQDLSNLCKKLDSYDRVFCHRDYHARNLMVKDNKIYWIDFQDARMGPHSYDVVSLVRDCYIDITWKTRKHLFDYYYKKLCEKRAEKKLNPIKSDDFFQELQFMGLQRNLKALGSFGFLATQKNKPDYLEYVPHTLKMICSSEALFFESSHEAQKLNSCFPTLFDILNSIVDEHTHQRFQNR